MHALLTLAAAALAAPVPPAPDAAPDVAGHYRCAGKDFDGDSYEGEVSIVKDNDVYHMSWRVTFRQKGASAPYRGVGLVTDRVLSAVWATPGLAGAMGYRVGKDGTLTGRWTLPGKNTLGTETLTPIRE